jgi:hypothetical protein
MKAMKVVKMIAWTAGMSAAAFLILDGKVRTPDAVKHAFLGAVLGLLLGSSLVWHERNSK